MAYDPNRGIDEQTYNDRTGSINQWLNQYLGRNASDEDYNRAYTGNFGGVENDIRSSDEAKAYAARQQQPSNQPRQWDRAAFVNGWLPLGSDVNAQNAYLQSWGLDPSKISGNGTMTMPDGSVMDIRKGARANDNTAQWMGMAWQGAGGGAGAPGAGGAGGVLGPGGAPVRDPRWNALYDELMNRAHQGLAVDANDPVIKAQVDANSAAQERERRRFLIAQAEKGSPYSTGAMGNLDRMTSERLGQNVAGFQAELLGREVAARRQEIADALNGARGMLSQEQTMALQKELAQMDDLTKRYGIDSSAGQFYADLGLRTDDRNNYWDWMRSGGVEG